jgi:hypothetical protein
VLFSRGCGANRAPPGAEAFEWIAIHLADPGAARVGFVARAGMFGDKLNTDNSANRECGPRNVIACPRSDGLVNCYDGNRGARMIQTAYVSRAAEAMTQESLLSLLQQCLANNEASGVTGMLLYGNNTFIQVLEGEEAVLDTVIDKIQKDPRHSKIHFLYRKPIEQRQYADWSMGFKRVSAQGLSAIAGLPGFGANDFNFDYLIENEAVVETLMEHFRVPHWDPLVRELDAKDKVIEYLKKALSHTRGCVEIANFVLENVAEASRSGRLDEQQLRLCESALDTLRLV